MLTEILTLGGLGALSSLGLGIASKVFEVEVDPRETAINDVLPKANCGACGLAGCSGLAAAIVKGEAPVSACTVGGASVAKKVAEIMGQEANLNAGEMLTAKTLCKGGCNEANEKFRYDGVMDCRAAILLAGGAKSCIYGCMGLGTCASVCPFDAIVMSPDRLPVIDQEKCTACGICVKACPKMIIELAPVSKDVFVACSSKDKGPVVKKNCSVGCIGCGICARTCPFEAIELKDNLARIDYQKCTNCGLCATKCPTNSIEDSLPGRDKAFILENCTGCQICKKVCPVDAITGDLKKIHIVDTERCIGCQICYSRCPVDAIEMKMEVYASH